MLKNVLVIECVGIVVGFKILVITIIPSSGRDSTEWYLRGGRGGSRMSMNGMVGSYVWFIVTGVGDLW